MIDNVKLSIAPRLQKQEVYPLFAFQMTRM